jgi:hypothetical protein
MKQTIAQRFMEKYCVASAAADKYRKINQLSLTRQDLIVNILRAINYTAKVKFAADAA